MAGIYTVGSWTTDSTINNLTLAGQGSSTGDNISNSNCFATEVCVLIVPRVSGDLLQLIEVAGLPDIDGTHWETPSETAPPSDPEGITKMGGGADFTVAGVPFAKRFMFQCIDMGSFTPYVHNRTPNPITATLTYRKLTANTQ
jgi:hypothetical protein